MERIALGARSLKTANLAQEILVVESLWTAKMAIILGHTAFGTIKVGQLKTYT